eukprot:13163758-Alexandrium_andersonii.AAC.1
MEEATTDLAKYESRYGSSFPQNLVRFVAWAMAAALAHLNRCQLVHGDVRGAVGCALPADAAFHSLKYPLIA